MYLKNLFLFPFLFLLISCGGSGAPSNPIENAAEDPETPEAVAASVLYGSRISLSDVGSQPFNETLSVGSVFYIDPINGKSTGDGSKNSPWQSLSEVINTQLIESQQWNQLPYDEITSYLIPRNSGAPIKAGSTLYLMSGDYGDLFLQGYYNTAPITLKAYPGQKPVFNSIRLQAGSNWIFDGINISKQQLISSNEVLFLAEKHNWQGPISNITLQNSYLSSSENTDNWSAEEWDLAANGIDSDATNFQAKNNTLENVGHGIIATGDETLVEYNTINHFSRDGIRALGNYSTYQFNLIKNSVQTSSGNHDDGIQSWETLGQVTGSTLHANVIIDYEDENQPYAAVSGLQGIGMFDGPFFDWIITDNIVIINHYHGITIADSQGAIIENNTVIDRNLNDDMVPWIYLATKNNLPAGDIKNNSIKNNIIANSVLLATDISDELNNISNNLFGSENVYPEIFYDYENFDIRLKD